MIFGVFGACRTDELTKIMTSHVKFHPEIRLLIVQVRETKTGVNRSFMISEEYFDIVHKYYKLRPSKVLSARFFIRYDKGRCTSQVIGHHKFSKMPSDIAQYLRLEEPKRYTGTFSLLGEEYK